MQKAVRPPTGYRTSVEARKDINNPAQFDGRERTYELPSVRLPDRVVRGRGIARVRAGPHDELILINSGVRPRLERRGVVLGEGKHRFMVEPIDPCLRVGLGALDGTNVVRLAVVVPRDDLNDIDGIAVGNQCLPTLGVQVIVGGVDPVLVVRVGAVVRVEEGGDGGDVRLPLQSVEVLLVGGDGADEVLDGGRQEVGQASGCTGRIAIRANCDGPCCVPLCNKSQFNELLHHLSEKTYVEHPAQPRAILVESRRVLEEGWEEMDIEAVEYSGPTVVHGPSVEHVLGSREGREHSLAIVHELIGVVQIWLEVLLDAFNSVGEYSHVLATEKI